MNCVQKFTTKHEKLWSENTKVEKPHVSNAQPSGHHQGDAESKGQHSYMVFQGTGKVEILAADNGLSQSSQLHDTVKSRIACGEKLSKKDAADVVIRQLTPYYKSRRFASKVQICLLFFICLLNLHFILTGLALVDTIAISKAEADYGLAESTISAYG